MKMKYCTVLTLVNVMEKQRLKRMVVALREKGMVVRVASPRFSEAHEARQSFLPPQYEFPSRFNNFSLEALDVLIAYTLSNLSGVASLFGCSCAEILLAKYLYKRYGAEFEDSSVIFISEVELLPLALMFSRIPIHVDLRDLYVYEDMEFYRRISKKLVAYLRLRRRQMIYKQFLWRAEFVSCVSKRHQEILQKNYGVKAKLIHSYPNLSKIKLNQPTVPIKYVYHGLALRVRGLEIICDAMEMSTAPAKLFLYLVSGEFDYIEELKKKFGDSGRIVFMDPVPYERLVSEMSQYDIGVAIFPDRNSTLEGAMPNKFFEYIHSRLAVIAPRKSEMGEAIIREGIGWVVSSPCDAYEISKVINDVVLRDVITAKIATGRMVQKYSWEHEKDRFLELYKDFS